MLSPGQLSFRAPTQLGSQDEQTRAEEDQRSRFRSRGPRAVPRISRGYCPGTGSAASRTGFTACEAVNSRDEATGIRREDVRRARPSATGQGQCKANRGRRILEPIFVDEYQVEIPHPVHVAGTVGVKSRLEPTDTIRLRNGAQREGTVYVKVNGPGGAHKVDVPPIGV